MKAEADGNDDRMKSREAVEGSEPEGANPCSIIGICEAWLTANGYDGLCDPVMECGCGVDDLMPCRSPGLTTCVPAYRELQSDGSWLMFPNRQEKK